MPLDLNQTEISNIKQTVHNLIEQYGKKALERVIQAIRINVDRDIIPKVLTNQSTSKFYFPYLNDKPWYEAVESEEFSKIFSLFETNFQSIKEEYFCAIKKKDLVSYEEQIPNIRKERTKTKEENVLLSKENWGTFSLMLGGQEIQDSCKKLPYTTSLMKSLKKANLLATGGAFFFSVLASKAHIPPHYDSTNIRLTFHLGIDIPQNCAIKVGSEERQWQEGKGLIFNSTFKHEAWNWSNKDRVCLILDIWNPNLTIIEKIALNTIYDRHLAPSIASNDK